VSEDRPEPPVDPYATAPLPPPYAQQPPAPPYGQEYYGAPPPPAAPPQTDAVSIAALVTSAVGALVASVPLGVVGLVRTKGRRRAGRWAAVTALVLSGAWLVVGVTVFALLGSSTSGGTAAGGLTVPGSAVPSQAPTPTETPTATPPVSPTATPTPAPTKTVKPAKVVTHSVYIGYVTKGHCFNEPKKGSSFVPELTTCRAPHDEEMMGTVQLGSGGYPGTSAAQRKADKACQKLFATFVGLPTDESELGLETWWPSPGLWGAGKHIAQCAVHSAEGKTVGTLRGARR
jgi:hypothetical protein